MAAKQVTTWPPIAKCLKLDDAKKLSIEDIQSALVDVKGEPEGSSGVRQSINDEKDLPIIKDNCVYIFGRKIKLIGKCKANCLSVTCKPGVRQYHVYWRTKDQRFVGYVGDHDVYGDAITKHIVSIWYHDGQTESKIDAYVVQFV